MTYEILVAILFGVAVGSFLNVCIHRLPKRQTLVWLNSHCPGCSAVLRPVENIPVVSYVLLRGRCRSCGMRIPLRYPLVEVINGVGYGTVAWQYGWTGEAVTYAGLLSALLVISVIDLQHQIIPDVITIPGIAVGILAAATILPVGLLNSVTGLLLGGGVLWGMAVLSPYVFGKEGMGGGDIKLLAMIGAFLGWRAVVITMLLGAAVGAMVALTLIACHVMRRDDYLPFGPFLALGAAISMLWTQELWDLYFTLLTPP